jgi:hypothetical protein
LSVVRLEKAVGLTLHVLGVDMLDGSPLLDLKPYVPYADALPAARSGWLDSEAEERPLDPLPGYEVKWSALAEEQAAWLSEEHGIDLVSNVEQTLRLGPEPHPYRRIRAEKDGMRLAVKDWRIRFHLEERLVVIDSLTTGYRVGQLAEGADAELIAHRRFVARFG